MPRENLDRQLHQLQDEILLMEVWLSIATTQAIWCALKSRSTSCQGNLQITTKVINEKRYAIENAI